MGQFGEVVGVAGEEGEGVVAVGWVGEHAGYAGALGGVCQSVLSGESCNWGQGRDCTAAGPAPMRMARPLGWGGIARIFDVFSSEECVKTYFDKKHEYVRLENRISTI